MKPEPGRAQPTAAPAATPTAAAITVRQLSIHYGHHAALCDVSLEIPPRSITAIIGPSGCGKSSFLSSLNRLTDLIPSCRVTGEIRVGSLPVLDRRTDVVQLRRTVGMIFQRPQPFPMSIRRNLELPLHEHGVRQAAEVADRIEATLRDVGLWDEVKDRLASSAVTLSGGQQQRLCLARALVLRPQILLLDEPCSALDPLSASVVEDQLRQLRRHYTLLVVTHHLAQARRLADQVALFWSQGRGGRLIESGPAAQVFETPRHELTAGYIDGRLG
jgi:phosphate transport system ATP-binding protein